jgi:hypothetical protein
MHRLNASKISRLVVTFDAGVVDLTFGGTRCAVMNTILDTIIGGMLVVAVKQETWEEAADLVTCYL